MTAPRLSIQGLEARYGDSQALFGIDFELGAEECVTLMGRNGMGKTTTVNSLMGLHGQRSGTILLDGQDVSAWPAHRISRAGLALVPEGRRIFPHLTVRENLQVGGASARTVRSPWTVDKVYALFPRLRERASNPGGKLSGGEQQMLSIGRALMTNPQVLILDEATEGLAPLIRQEIWHCLAELKRTGLSLVLIDKNVQPLLALAHRHVVLDKGRVAWQGTTAMLREDPSLLDRYVGV